MLTLRQSERQAERDRERLREVHVLQDEQIQREIQQLQKQLQETDKDRNILFVSLPVGVQLAPWNDPWNTKRKTQNVLWIYQGCDLSVLRWKFLFSDPNQWPMWIVEIYKYIITVYLLCNFVYLHVNTVIDARTDSSGHLHDNFEHL